MKEAIQFAVLGLGLAAVYSLLASGIVLIYRGSGIVNFAQGAFALVGAIIFTELHRSGLSWVEAIVLAVLGGAVLGAAVQLLVMRRLRTAAPIARVIATLAFLIIIQAAAALHYSATVTVVHQYLPQHPWTILDVTVQSDRVILFGIAALICCVLGLMQSRWRVGLASRAAAENDVAAATLGWSPELLATISWSTGAALAALAGALIVPLTGLLVGNIVLLVVPALAAALLGRFDSFFGALGGAALIGIGQSLITRYVTQTGAGEAFPFLVIIVVLIVSGRALPLRSHVTERLPSIGSGRIRPLPVAIAFVVGVVLMLFVFDGEWIEAFTVSISAALVYLSIVVLTGYAGQISLMQFAFAGLGAYVAGRLVATTGVPFAGALVLGVVAAVPIGGFLALPAIRTRGVNLAVITLGIGVAVTALVFSNVAYTGGLSGTTVGSPHLFGIDIGAVDYPERYGVFVLVLFTLAALLVANLRRSAAGRRLIAIRENERAASSLGVSVTGAKLYAFAIAAALAALGGILIAFHNTSILYSTFTPLDSIYAVAYVVIGGLGYVFGPLIGATLVTGGIGTLFSNLIPSINEYLALIGGAAVLAILILNPDGSVSQQIKMAKALRDRLRRRGQGEAVEPAKAATISEPRPDSVPEPSRPGSGAAIASAVTGGEKVVPRTLTVSDLTVRFGAVTAVDNVSMTVRPGEVVGLIGPNGAGKTTFIDALTGFVSQSSGEITLGDEQIGSRPPQRRASLGLVRSWQSLELFEDVSVEENLLVASESASWSVGTAVRSLVYPRKPHLGAAALAAADEFELRGDLGRLPTDLPYGRRRLVGIARAVSLGPSILLLDEPAAGLTSAESGKLGRLLRRLSDAWGMGVLLVEHDVDLVMSVCDRITVLNFGATIAEGTPDAVRTDERVIEAYLGSTDKKTHARKAPHAS